VKLLFDENLSDKVVLRISDLYPESEHVKNLGLTHTKDTIIWEYAKNHNFVIVSKDSDFYDRSLMLGHPPKFIYLRIKNCPSSQIVRVLRSNFNFITDFGKNPLQNLLILLG